MIPVRLLNQKEFIPELSLLCIRSHDAGPKFHKVFTVPYYSVGFSRLVRFDRTLAILVWGARLNYQGRP